MEINLGIFIVGQLGKNEKYEESFRQLILKLKNNQYVNSGSQIGRQSSEPKKS